MGEVWKAWDTKAERPIVLKLVPPELQHAQEEMGRVKATFQRIYALQHQHICPVYGLDEDHRFGWYVSMKFIDGQTLSAYRTTYVARHGAFPVEQVAKVLRPVAAALDYAHAQGVIHRDVKPQNILVVGDAEDVQVVDFGLAAEIRTTMSRVSQQRMDTSGTRPYMAPEQWKGQPQETTPPDQYALAVVAYELICGRLPFESQDLEVLRLCVLNDPPVAIGGQTKALNRALTLGLAKRRQERFGSCREFVESLMAPFATEQATVEESRRNTSELQRVRLENLQFDIDEIHRLLLLGKRAKGHLDAVWERRIKAWRRAANQGLPGGQWLLGVCYKSGKGAPRDQIEAVEWYCKAAEQGYAPAQNDLGNCYYNGQGVLPDRRKAVEWYRKAAEQG